MGAQKSKLGKKDLQELAAKTSCKYFSIVLVGADSVAGSWRTISREFAANSSHRHVFFVIVRQYSWKVEKKV